MAVGTAVNITDTIAQGQQPIAYGGGPLEIEFFRVPFTAGIALAETVAITPRFLSDVRFVQSNHPATDNLSLTVANTNVTLTLRTSIASTIDGNFMVSIIGRR